MSAWVCERVREMSTTTNLDKPFRTKLQVMSLEGWRFVTRPHIVPSRLLGEIDGL